MTVTDQIKILNRKIKQNESHYDLDRKAAEISALPCKKNAVYFFNPFGITLIFTSNSLSSEKIK